VRSEKIESQEEGLENLRLSVEALKRSLDGELNQVKSGLENLGSALEGVKTSIDGELNQLKSGLGNLPPTPTPPVGPAPANPPNPIKAKRSLGVLSVLPKEHGGNVQEKGTVIITSKSGFDDEPGHALKNLADLTTNSSFTSKNEPGQWVCWDFRETRVRPTYYMIMGYQLKSWVVEGSLNGTNWTEIDRKTDNQTSKGAGWVKASFAVATVAECRFIRLTQTDKRHDGQDYMPLQAVEFFGTLSE
jgi:hypothetical protein